MQENIINSLLIKCDSNKQYSQRSCLHIHDIESDNKNGLEKVKKNATICWIYLLPKKVDVSCRIGKKYKDRNSGKKVKSIIIKCKLWKFRQQLYNTLSQIFKKRTGQNFTISVNLTRRCYSLLKKARGTIKDNKAKKMVFGNIHCFLAV